MTQGIPAIGDGDAGRHECEDRFRLLELARDKGMREMGKHWVPGMVHPERLGTPLYRAILDMIERSTPEKFEAQIAALLGRPDASEHLPLIACPTTIICGRQDSWSPLSRHEAIHAAIVGSTLRAIEDCGPYVDHGATSHGVSKARADGMDRSYLPYSTQRRACMTDDALNEMNRLIAEDHCRTLLLKAAANRQWKCIGVCGTVFLDRDASKTRWPDTLWPGCDCCVL